MSHARSLVVLLLILLSNGALIAQSESGSAAIAGIVLDPSGDPAPNVAVVARHIDTAAVRTAVTDAAGRFALVAMPVGSYVVDATLPGFATIHYDAVVLSVGETRRLAMALTVSGVVESVTVTSH